MTDQQCADAADSNVVMEDVPPSAKDELFWTGEELVQVKDKFYPKRQASQSTRQFNSHSTYHAEA